MSTYLAPADIWISATWADHRGRTPPSAEPGTDYATAYGVDLRMAEAGTVSVVDTSPSGGEGRRLSIDLDDGRRVSYLHLSQISPGVHVGMRVVRGQQGVCLSGASGNGSDWYYGAHVHVSLWERPGMPYADTIDFQQHVGEPPPAPPVLERWRDMTYRIIPDASSDAIYVVSLATGIRTRITDPGHVGLLERARADDNDDEMLTAELDIVHGYLEQINPSDAATVGAAARKWGPLAAAALALLLALAAIARR